MGLSIDLYKNNDRFLLVFLQFYYGTKFRVLFLLIKLISRVISGNQFFQLLSLDLN